MAEIPINKTIEKSQKINLPMIFLILIIILTIWIYWYNTYLESQNNDLDKKISDKQIEIDKIKKDKNIKVFALIQDNKKTLDKLEAYSQITKLINWMTYIQDNYDLILDWFSYSNWIITTKAYTDPNKMSNPYETTSHFIQAYRIDKNPNAIFNLPYISRVSWIENMTFNLKLEVKQNFLNNKIKK